LLQGCAAGRGKLVLRGGEPLNSDGGDRQDHAAARTGAPPTRPPPR
jgi:hypothetical protein